MRIRRALAPAAVLVAVAATALTAPAALAAVTGDVAVIVEDADGAPQEGVELTLTSGNCAVATPSAVTDASGVATFTGLAYFTDETESENCDYDLTQVVPDGYEQVTATAALLGLQAGELLAAPSTIQLDSADGVFSAAGRVDSADIQCLEGVGTATMVAGRYFLSTASAPDCTTDNYEKSGLSYEGPAAAVDLPAGVTRVSTLWHINRNIQRPFHTATLEVELVVTDTTTGDTATVVRTFEFTIDETDNLDEEHGSVSTLEGQLEAIADYDPADCKFPDAPNGGIVIENPLYNAQFPIFGPEFYEFGCADLITVTEVGDPGSERVGNAMVDFSLDLALAGDQGECADPASPSYTQENADTEICLLLGVDIEAATNVLTVSIVNDVIEDEVVVVDDADDEVLAATGASDHVLLFGIGGVLMLLAGGILAVARRRD